MPELIVALLFLRIAEDLIGLCSFFELFLCTGISGVLVRVILDGEFAVGFFDLVGRSALAHAQYFVVISFCHTDLFADYDLGVANDLFSEFVSLFDDVDHFALEFL